LVTGAAQHIAAQRADAAFVVDNEDGAHLAGVITAARATPRVREPPYIARGWVKVVAIDRVGTLDSRPYLVSERVRGDGTLYSVNGTLGNRSMTKDPDRRRRVDSGSRMDAGRRAGSRRK